MGGDVYKSISLGKKITGQSTSLFSVFMDRFSGLVILLVVGLFGLGSYFGTYGGLGSLAILGVGLTLYFPVLNLVASKVKFFRKFRDASLLFVKNWKCGLVVLGFSLLIQATSFALSYVLFFGFGVVLPLWSIFAFMPLVSLAILVPSFNGFGTQDTLYAVLFAQAGVTPEISVAVSFLIHGIRILMSLIGGIFILFGREL